MVFKDAKSLATWLKTCGLPQHAEPAISKSLWKNGIRHSLELIGISSSQALVDAKWLQLAHANLLYNTVEKHFGGVVGSNNDSSYCRTVIRKIEELTVKENTKIEKGKTSKLPVLNTRILNPNLDEMVFYYGREGTEELFGLLTTASTNVSITGHPGSGKSNLCWAVAHELAKQTTVLWLSHVEFQQDWEVRLFRQKSSNEGLVYMLKSTSLDVKEIMDDPAMKDVTVLILDAPTKSKTLTSKDGLRAFEWASEPKTQRRVIHSSSLGCFSTDERVTSYHSLSNFEMPPWTMKDYVDALNASKELKVKVCATMGLNVSTDTVKVVLSKLHYAGINARWFFNLSISEIMKACKKIVDRLDPDNENLGNSHVRAVNSAYMSYTSTAQSLSSTITLYTSAHLALELAQNKSECVKFFRLYPLLKDRLGCGSPGEIFEADFLLHLEHAHALAQAQRYVLGGVAPESFVRIGVDISNEKEVLWPAGVIHKLEKNPSKDESSVQPMPIEESDVDSSNALWFDPIDKQQPFLDFFVLIPEERGGEGEPDKWKLRVLQATAGQTHSTVLAQLARVVEGILFAGFSLIDVVDVAYIVEKASQKELGKSIDGAILDVKVLSKKRPSRDNAAIQRFSIHVMRVLYERTADVPTAP